MKDAARSGISCLYGFGDFRLDPNRRRLFHDEETILLSPKALETLIVLVRNAGKVLHRDELMEAVWPDAVVEDANLTVAISQLRKALGQQRDPDEFIQTIPRVGYRFMVPVREVIDGTDAVVVETHSRERTLIREHIVEQEEETHAETSRHALTIAARSLVRSPVGVSVLIVTASALLITMGFVVSRFSSASTAGSTPAKSMTADQAAARDAYRNGRALWNKRTSASQFASLRQFQLAITKDPNFALAYDGLADAYAFDSIKWHDAEALAKKALDIDKNLGEAHATLGFIRTFWEWDWKGGEREFRQAIELSPDYATAHQWYAVHLAVNSRLIEAEVEMRRALELDQKSPAINADLGQILYFERKYDEAIEACRKALEIDPDFFNAHYYLYEIYCQKQLGDQAFAEAVKLGQSEGTGVVAFADKERRAYQQSGLKGFWQLQVRKLQMLGGFHYDVAELHARLGEKDATLAELERAWHSHDFNMIFFTVNPAFLSLHADPRFVRLQGQMWTLPAVL